MEARRSRAPEDSVKQMKPKFSIILNCYDVDRAQRHQTIACIAAITKFTDGAYELIIIDNLPKFDIKDDYKVFKIAKHVKLDELETVYASYNRGAKLASTDNLFFIQNDVFVHNRTLNKLMVYLEEWEMVFPQQHNTSREDALEVMNTPVGEQTHIGWRDAGLVGMRREAFDRAGGWDERFRNLLGEAGFYARCGNADVTWTDRTNAFITHIMAGNNLRKEAGLYNEEMDHDAKLLEEYK